MISRFFKAAWWPMRELERIGNHPRSSNWTFTAAMLLAAVYMMLLVTAVFFIANIFLSIFQGGWLLVFVVVTLLWAGFAVLRIEIQDRREANERTGE